MKKDKYLPIGSVVSLQGMDRKVMIFGRCHKQSSTNKVWDYIACLYPEGNISLRQSFQFQHEQIETVYFVGYTNEEEEEFVSVFLELEVV